MPRTKKVVEENVEENVEEIKDTVIEETKATSKTTNKELEDLKKQVEEKDNINKAMQDQINQLQQMLLQMQSNQNTVLANQANNSGNLRKDEKVKLVSYLYSRNVFTNETGTIVADFPDTESVVIVGQKALDSIMSKSKNRELFVKGLLAFAKGYENWYDEYDIIKPQVISPEYLKEVFQLNRDECFAKLNQITNNGTDTVTKVTVFWNSIRLLAKGELGFPQQALIKEYFNCYDIDTKIEMVHYAKEKNFLK